MCDPEREKSSLPPPLIHYLLHEGRGREKQRRKERGRRRARIKRQDCSCRVWTVERIHQRPDSGEHISTAKAYFGLSTVVRTLTDNAFIITTKCLIPALTLT